MRIGQRSKGTHVHLEDKKSTRDITYNMINVSNTEARYI